MAWFRPSSHLASSDRHPPCWFPSGAVRTQIAVCSRTRLAEQFIYYLFYLLLASELLTSKQPTSELLSIRQPVAEDDPTPGGRDAESPRRPAPGEQTTGPQNSSAGERKRGIQTAKAHRVTRSWGETGTKSRDKGHKTKPPSKRLQGFSVA